MKKIRILLIIIIIFTVILSTIGCQGFNYNYSGEYPELYSVAINSLLFSRGFRSSEIIFDPGIEVKEIDNFGRTLYIYSEGNNGEVELYCLIISQKSDENHAYFYPDYNIISSLLDDTLPKDQSTEEEGFAYYYSTTYSYVRCKFDIESIEYLKEQNDWNKEINESKCIKVDIVHNKTNGPLKSEQWENLYTRTFPESANKYNNATVYYFCSDDYGRLIYCARNATYPNIKYAVFLFQPDGSYNINKCVMKINDLYHCQDELKAFKDMNNWNKPL